MLKKLLSASVVSISQHVIPNVIPLAAIRYNSSLVQQFQQANLKTIFKTHVQDPMKHTVLHEGLFYTMPENHASQILGVKALGTNFKKQCDLFQETCIMVRKPALEVLDYIKNANYDHPVLRIILYGEMGVGKTLTLAHALHACATHGWILVHVSWPSIWKKTWKEISMSTYKQGRIDFPVISVEWLKLFQTQNESFLDNLKTTSKYIWSKRESAEEGLTFSELIKFVCIILFSYFSPLVIFSFLVEMLLMALLLLLHSCSTSKAPSHGFYLIGHAGKQVFSIIDSDFIT